MNKERERKKEKEKKVSVCVGACGSPTQRRNTLARRRKQTHLRLPSAAHSLYPSSFPFTFSFSFFFSFFCKV